VNLRIPPARVHFPLEDRRTILQEIDEALATGQLTLGKHVRAFEDGFAQQAGTRGNGSLCEDEPFYLPDAGHIYTSSKIASEMIIHNYWQLYRQPFTIRKALKGEPIVIQGDGSQYRNYVYIDDVARAHMLALSGRAENQVYNLEGAQKITIKDIADTLKRVLGGGVKIEYVPARPGDYGGKKVSASKILKELEWEPKVGFEEGMRRTIEWFKPLYR
jgi:UDP-glucose 4-epimerase